MAVDAEGDFRILRCSRDLCIDDTTKKHACILIFRSEQSMLALAKLLI